jgi:predicted TIM-barrel fold metal-dependent hydrolase
MQRAPHRLLFGSDWPYIGLDKDLPTVGGLLDLFHRWTDDAALREALLVRNPIELYG